MYSIMTEKQKATIGKRLHSGIGGSGVEKRSYIAPIYVQEAAKKILKNMGLDLVFIYQESSHPDDYCLFAAIAYRKRDDTYIVYRFNLSTMDFNNGVYDLNFINALEIPKERIH